MKEKLLIVTDLGLLKAYQLNTTPKGTLRLELVEEVTLEEVRHRLTEKVTDLAGRRAAPRARHWGAPLADAHNLQLETKRRLVKRIAANITRLVRAYALDGCWLAAHKEINHSILGALPAAIRQRIETNLVRDLVKARGPELLEAFGLEARRPGG